MGLTGTILLGVIFVVWHIVSSKIQQSAKRQEEQRRRELLAKRQQQQQGVSAGPGTSTTLQPTGFRPPAQAARPQQRGPLGASARDELAARRQAQLEELRRRRQAQGGGSPPARPAKSAKPAIPDLSRPRATPPGTPPPSPADLWRAEQARQLRERQQRQQESARLKAEAERRRAAQRQTTESAAQKERLREKLEQQRHAREAAAIVSGVPVGGTSSDRVRAMVQQPTTLRDAFILKELLDKPLSERGQGGGQISTD